MTIIQASRTVFENYLQSLNILFSNEKDKHIQQRQLQLISMCQTVLNHTSPYDNGRNLMTDDKISRWLGFVQGIMTVYGWITVEGERETTRPIFHEAYKDLGLHKPDSITAKLDDIKFHIVDMQDFNKRCIEKYHCDSYRNISLKKQKKICFQIMKEDKPMIYKTLKKLNYTVTFSTTGNDKYTFLFSELELN